MPVHVFSYRFDDCRVAPGLPRSIGARRATGSEKRHLCLNRTMKPACGCILCDGGPSSSHASCVRARSSMTSSIRYETETFFSVSSGGRLKRIIKETLLFPLRKEDGRAAASFRRTSTKCIFAVLSNPQMCCGLERKEILLEVGGRPANGNIR